MAESAAAVLVHKLMGVPHFVTSGMSSIDKKLKDYTSVSHSPKDETCLSPRIANHLKLPPESEGAGYREPVCVVYHPAVTGQHC